MTNKKQESIWPIYFAPLLFLSRTDFIIPLLIKYFEVDSQGIIFLFASIIQISTFLGWYYIFGKIIRLKLDVLTGITGSKFAKKHLIVDDIKMGKETVEEAIQQGIWDDIKMTYEEVKKLLIDKYIWVRDPENPIVKKYKKRGYWSVFFAGVNPFGTRTISIGVCRVVRSKKSFLILNIGALTYNLWSTFMWSWLFN